MECFSIDLYIFLLNNCEQVVPKGQCFGTIFLHVYVNDIVNTSYRLASYAT